MIPTTKGFPDRAFMIRQQHLQWIGWFFCQQIHPKYMVDSSTKNLFLSILKWVKLSYVQIIFPTSFAGQRFLNKIPTVWLDGAGPPSTYVIAQPDNTFGGLADFFKSGNAPNVHGGLINNI